MTAILKIQGESVVVSTDKKHYIVGERVAVIAETSDTTNVEAVMDNGTSFRVDLPLTIPVLNVQRIYQPYWWFILVSLIANISLSIIIGQARKRGILK